MRSKAQIEEAIKHCNEVTNKTLFAMFDKNARYLTPLEKHELITAFTAANFSSEALKWAMSKGKDKFGVIPLRENEYAGGP